jgi:predicted XRE-type DNA-binding protein
VVLVEDALKAALVHRIATLVKRENLTQTDAAKRMGITQPDVSKMLKGQFRPFSLERLMRFLNALGQDVEIAVMELLTDRCLVLCKATGA